MPINWLMTYWACWLLGIVITFAVPEWWAIRTGGMTFSSFMWTITEEWGPIWPFVWGILLGGLAVHFWWHWSPPGSTGAG